MIHIHWVPPDGWAVKLNTDGAAKGNPGLAGPGGLIRSSAGSWLIGFQLHLVICSNMEDELSFLFSKAVSEVSKSCGRRSVRGRARIDATLELVGYLLRWSYARFLSIRDS